MDYKSITVEMLNLAPALGADRVGGGRGEGGQLHAVPVDRRCVYRLPLRLFLGCALPLNGIYQTRPREVANPCVHDLTRLL